MIISQNFKLKLENNTRKTGQQTDKNIETILKHLLNLHIE